VVAPLDSQGRRLHSLLGSAGDNALGTKAPLKEDLVSNPKFRGKVKATRRAEASAGRVEEEMSVVELAAREREGGQDMDEVFARNVVRLGGRYKGAEFSGLTGSRAGFDEEEDVDTKMYQGTEARMTQAKLREKERASAVAAHQRYLATMHQSPYSLENPHFRHWLVCARGERAYLMLRTNGLHPLQAAVVACEQAPSMRAVSEEVFAEVLQFKQALRRCLGAQGLGCIFIETAGRGGKAWAHLDCVPVPLEVEEDAPLYFKQALSSCDEEWATHKASIDTTKPGGLRKAIPMGFPYFHAEWVPSGHGGGAAHVIEDPDKFPANFGLGVVAGMLGVDPPRHTKGQGGPGREAERRAAEHFTNLFKPFDWTSQA